MNTTQEKDGAFDGLGALPLQVKKPPRAKIIGMLTVISAVILANYLLFSGNKTLTDTKENDSYDTSHLSPLSQNLSTQIRNVHTVQKTQPLTTGLPSLKDDLQDNLKQEVAKAKAQDFIERLQAVQNNNGSSSLNSNNRLLSQQNGTENLTGGANKQNTAYLTDPNTAFLVQASNSKAEHMYATHYGSLPYVLGQGKFIFGNLSVAINSDLPGQITATVSQNVYGDQGRKILIPRGSILIGEYKSGLVNNQSRLFIVWQRVREPNGIDAMLGSEGTDALGRAGLTGSVDYHFMARFGAATLVSLLGAGASTVGVGNGDEYNSSASYRQELTQALSQQSSSMLSQSLNIPPTVHVPQGEKIVVFVNRDIDFSKVLK